MPTSSERKKSKNTKYSIDISVYSQIQALSSWGYHSITSVAFSKQVIALVLSYENKIFFTRQLKSFSFEVVVHKQRCSHGLSSSTQTPWSVRWTLNWIILIGVSLACEASQYALTWRSLPLREQASVRQIISPWTMFTEYWLKIVLYYFFRNVATKWWRNCTYTGTCTVGAFSKASSSWRHGDWAHLPPGDNFATSS